MHFFRINFLDKRLEQLDKTVAEKCLHSLPIMLLMDNINMYRGKKRHDRLFKEIGPKMCNFTGRAAVIPDVSSIADLLSCKETTTESQTDIADLQFEDILLGKTALKIMSMAVCLIWISPCC